MQLASADFQHLGEIPPEFTCDGGNRSPELSWRDAPPTTKSFALVMHDPDAPRPGGFTHWILYNIPSNVAALEPIMPSEGRIPGTGVQGRNDNGEIGYMGPCPPSGTHRYFVRLYALDAELKLAPGASRGELETAMRGHVLDQTELMGTYARLVRKRA
jgi:Raf kinase inhibitor-like YbhB/YbcL family protein